MSHWMKHLPGSPLKPLAIEILASEMRLATDGKPGRVRVVQFRSRPLRLNVLLRNTSDRPLRLWEEGNSWGFENLKLDVLALDGKTLPKPIRVVRTAAGWGANGPTFSELPPGESLIREVLLEGPSKGVPSVWTYFNFPLPNNSEYRAIRLRAVYDIPKEAAAEKLKILTGQITSEPQDYLMRIEPGV